MSNFKNPEGNANSEPLRIERPSPLLLMTIDNKGSREVLPMTYGNTRVQTFGHNYDYMNYVVFVDEVQERIRYLFGYEGMTLELQNAGFPETHDPYPTDRIIDMYEAYQAERLAAELGQVGMQGPEGE